MEKILINVSREDFVVHIDKDGPWQSGNVYPIYLYDDGLYDYVSSTSSDSVDTEEDARCLFGFIFCWRGVWEGRIYFKDKEYWSEELDTIKELWDKIEAILKNRIRKVNPQIPED